MAMEIDVVGGKIAYTPAEIAALLAVAPTEMKHGDSFGGRPGTRLYVGEEHVVKVRVDVCVAEKMAREWVADAVEREARYGVHHPLKTWFLIHDRDGGGPPQIANACPRLLPLHQWLTTLGETEGRRAVPYFSDLFSLYFRVANDHAMRLDEGLSNFGLDPDARVYYLDDDIYRWDNYHSFVHALGIYLRAHTWLTPEIADLFGGLLRIKLDEAGVGLSQRQVIAAELRNLFMPEGRARRGQGRILEYICGRDHRSRPKLKGRYLALFGDVHANLPALEAVLDFFKKEGVDQGLILGDTVGYGPHPEACIDRLAETRFMAIQGNHDSAVINIAGRATFSPRARWAIEWTASRLDKARSEWLSLLPLMAQGKGWIAVHGAPVDPTYINGYVYDMTFERNLDVLQERGIPRCFHGHTHIAKVYGRTPGLPDRVDDGSTHELKRFKYCLASPGSVGQSRQGKALAHCGIYDMEAQELHFFALPYEVERTARDMAEHGFPQELIRRLREGI